MKLNDLLLLVAAVLLMAAGWTVAPSLGLAVGGVCAGISWFLLGEAS